MPNAFLPAITGMQSRAIADALRTAGWTVTGSSRSDEGDPREHAEGTQLLVLTIPQDHQPGAMTQFVDYWVEAARSIRAERIVLNLGGTPGPADEHPFFADLHAAAATVRSSGLAHVILQPTVYLENLAAPWAREAMDSGVIAYPAVAEAKISWMSHRTLGSWVSAVANGAADDKLVQVGGPAALTGEELARAIGNAIGRELQYVPISPEDFAAGIDAAFGAPAGDRLASIYRSLARRPDSMAVDAAADSAFGVEYETASEFAHRLLVKT